MSQFIFFFRESELPEDFKTYQDSWTHWIKKLKENGHLITGAPLLADGVIVKNRGELVENFIFDFKTNASDFMIIEAQDMQAAIQLSKTCPIFFLNGTITIRPIIRPY